MRDIVENHSPDINYFHQDEMPGRGTRVVKRLNSELQKSKVSKSKPPVIRVSIKQAETEQAASDKAKALRLFCRSMIRLYLQDQEDPALGKRLGVL